MRQGISALRLIVCGLLFLCLAEGVSTAKQVAVIVNKGNSAEEMSATDLGKIFKCNTRKWASGGAITVVVLDPATPEMELLLSRIYKTTPENLRSFIAAHHDAIIIVDSNEAMLKTVRSLPGAIGLIDVFRINQEVKVLKIDGKLPVEYGYILRGN
jgi:ABC-type phosphate transport system substrate-binding protein